jgi:hypothetical protein
MTEIDPVGTGHWRFDDLRAMFINCTLKRSPELSHTQGLIDLSTAIMARHDIAVTELRAVDHDIDTGRRLAVRLRQPGLPLNSQRHPHARHRQLGSARRHALRTADVPRPVPATREQGG